MKVTVEGTATQAEADAAGLRLARQIAQQVQRKEAERVLGQQTPDGGTQADGLQAQPPARRPAKAGAPRR
jgi:hypothetical protein